MKGLLLKDLAILKCQKRFYGIMILFCVLYSYILEDSSFAIGYVVLMCSIMTLNSLAYDEHDNGNAFLFTMPFTRAEYVKAKYVFGILSIAGCAILSVAICFIMGLVKMRTMGTEVIIAAFITSLIGIIFMSLNLPVHIKFGAEKGKVVVVVFGFGMFVLLTFISKMEIAGDVIGILPWIESLTAQEVSIGVSVLAVIVTAVSMRVAIKEMEKKEF